MSTKTSVFFDAAVTAAVNVSTACRGQLMSLQAYNVNATDAWLQVFNVPAASVTLGTTTPIQSFLVPKGNGTDRGATEMSWTEGLNLDGSAISIAATTTETGSTTATTGLEVNVQFR